MKSIIIPQSYFLNFIVKSQGKQDARKKCDCWKKYARSQLESPKRSSKIDKVGPETCKIRKFLLLKKMKGGGDKIK